MKAASTPDPDFLLSFLPRHECTIALFAVVCLGSSNLARNHGNGSSIRLKSTRECSVCKHEAKNVSLFLNTSEISHHISAPQSGSTS